MNLEVVCVLVTINALLLICLHILISSLAKINESDIIQLMKKSRDKTGETRFHSFILRIRHAGMINTTALLIGIGLVILLPLLDGSFLVSPIYGSFIVFESYCVFAFWMAHDLFSRILKNI